MNLSAPVVRAQVEAVLDRANLHAAFGRVAENHGCRGADGVTIGEFRDRLEEDVNGCLKRRDFGDQKRRGDLLNIVRAPQARVS